MRQVSPPAALAVRKTSPASCIRESTVELKSGRAAPMLTVA